MSQRSELTEPQPFFHLVRSAELHPTRPALVSADLELSFEELLTQSARIAALLRRRGVTRGDVVAVALRNDLQLVFAEALFALAAVGCILPGELDQLGPLAVDHFVTGSTEPTSPLERTIIVDDGFFAEAAGIVEPLAIDAYDDLDSVCRIAFSSGTTGRPSPLPLTLRIMEGRSRLYDDDWLPALPLMSLVSLSGALSQHVAYSNLACGDPYLSPGTPEENLTMIRDNAVGTLIASPAQLADLAGAARRAGGGLEGLAVVHTAGSLVPPALISALAACTQAELLSFYGSTEVGPVMVGPLGPGGTVRFEPLAIDQQVEVVDAAGGPVPLGQAGQLRIRSALAASGYLGTGAEGTAFRDGCFYPGDLAVQHADGTFSLEGRAGEVMNLGGVKIDPASIDDALQALPGVEDAAVFHVASRLGADLPVVALVGDATVDLALVAAAFRSAAQGISLEAIFAVAAIPRSPMGKVRREELAASYRRSLEG